MINFKTYSKNFRNKKRINNPEENWVIFKDVHEPIIERGVFERVQEMKAKTKRRAPKNNGGEKHLLSDYLYCGDCHSKLWYHTNTINKNIHFFSCSNYAKDYRGTCPTRHYIRADAIEQVVMLELRRLAAFLQDYEKLYEDHAENKISEEWFMHMSQKYETERMELKSKISRLRRELAEADALKLGQESFVKAIRKFLQMQTLTKPLLQELIDHIDVFETEGTGKNRTQRITVYYRFVGYIEIPEVPKRRRENYVADTRQGVSVEYVPQIAAGATA